MSISNQKVIGPKQIPDASAKRPALSAFERFVELTVGIVLVASGLMHLAQPYFFMQTVASYEIIPLGMVPVISIIISSIQVALGLGILFQLFPTVGPPLAMLLFMVFAIAQMSVLWRGIMIDCGCFGFSSTQINAKTVIIPCALSLACLYLIVKRRKGAVPGSPPSNPSLSKESLAKIGVE